MKYYLIAGEASGDLHASHLMKALRTYDGQAEFRFFGGDLMAAVGGTCVKHYRELAFMGYGPVLTHLTTILLNKKTCKAPIAEWKPDAVILVDYPGFNLNIAKYVRRKGICPVYYFIAPKIWAWKEYRIKNIRRDVDELFSILPFEVDFFEKKHHYPIHYVGNPTAHEVETFLNNYDEDFETFARRNRLDADKPVIALLAGSRLQEIRDNLPVMLQAAEPFADTYQLVIAGAPAISTEYYHKYIGSAKATLVMQQTYPLLRHAAAALVTSGTATLETALFAVPQVVCYKTPLPHLARWAFSHVMSCRYISLVNLIADREVVEELFADRFSAANIREELARLLPATDGQQTTACSQQLAGYEEVRRRLGSNIAPDNAARLITEIINRQTGNSSSQ